MSNMLSKRTVNRVNLNDVIPLKSPYFVSIDPSDCCNLRCKYCFNKFNENKIGLMSIETYKQIIKGLKELGRVKTIHLYKQGEPLINPNITEMVKIGKEICDKVWIKSNGTFLTPILASNLAKAGLDVLTISIIAPTTKQYFELTGKTVDYDKLKNTIAECYKEIKSITWLHVKMADASFSKEELQKFKDDFANICDHVDIEYLQQPAGENNFDFTLGTNPKCGMQGEKINSKIVCPYPFYSINIHRNGDVTVCCVDYIGYTKIGNINENTVNEIWNGKKFNDFRKMHLLGNRGLNKACKECKHIDSLPDNIDKDREDILRRIKC